MLFLKLDDLYWDGEDFQSDFRKAIVYGSVMAASKDLGRNGKAKRRRKELDGESLRLVPLTNEQLSLLRAIERS